MPLDRSVVSADNNHPNLVKNADSEHVQKWSSVIKAHMRVRAIMRFYSASAFLPLK